MSDRGDYRSIYCAFWDDPDVHALSDRAYRVLTTLKGTLGAAGIGVVYLGQLAERCGCAPADLEAALLELEQSKPCADHGWIVRDRNVVWIVNALEYEPTLSASNANHRTYVRERLLAPLGRRAVVERFIAYYPAWFPPSDPSPMPLGRVGDGSRSTVQSSPALSSPSRSRSQSTARAADDPPAVVGVIGGESTAAVVLAAAANRGITERWGEQINPIRHNAPKTLEAVEQLARAGVPVAFARDAIYTWCTTTTKGEPPRTLTYFVGHVVDRWHASQEYAAAATSDAKPLAESPAGTVDPYLAAARQLAAKEAAHG